LPQLHNFPQVRSGPILIAHDGSRSAELAMEEAAALFAPRKALIVTVWEPGPAFQALAAPPMQLAPIEIRTALELGEKIYERAQELAEQVAERARKGGLDASGLAVVDDLTIGQTILRVAKERGAPAIVLGAHGHRVVREILLGSTTREVMLHAECPVVVVRDREHK
jgi:nucleotide-binding universal stress UspA family protein